MFDLVRGSGSSSPTGRAFLLTGALALGLLGGSAVAAVAQSDLAEPAPGGSAAVLEYLGTNPPDGTYHADVSYLDLVTHGSSKSFAQVNQGPWTWTFLDGTFALKHVGYGEDCSGTYESDGTRVRMVTTVEAGCSNDMDIRWAPMPEGIRIEWIPTEGASDETADMTAYFDRVFVRAD